LIPKASCVGLAEIMLAAARNLARR